MPVARFVAYWHRCFGSPSLSTFKRALSRGFITVPHLTAKLVSRYPPLSLSTSFGHLDTLRKGIASSRRKISPSCLGLVTTDSLPSRASSRLASSLNSFPSDATRSRTICRSEWTAADLTGRFPIPSYDGFEYLLVFLHCNYIHFVTLKSRTSASYVHAFRSACAFFSSHSRPITHIQMDNETSTDLTTFFSSSQPKIKVQYVPPQNHRANRAERSIRTGKNHFLSVLSACHITFPPNRWPDLLPATELTLNHLRSSSLDPLLSAWHGLHGSAIDFLAHPIHPPGQLVVAHDSPLKRASWAHHGVRGFYLSPALTHYRCHLVFIPKTGATRVTDTLDLFPDPLFPFEDPSSDPVVPDPTTDRPHPTYAGTDLIGREFWDDELGLCKVVGPAQPSFLSPQTGNLDAAPFLAPGWHPTLQYRSAAGQLERSTVEEVARWVAAYQPSTTPPPPPPPSVLPPLPPALARVARPPSRTSPRLPALARVARPLSRATLPLPAGTAGAPLPPGPAPAPLRRSLRLATHLEQVLGLGNPAALASFPPHNPSFPNHLSPLPTSVFRKFTSPNHRSPYATFPAVSCSTVAFPLPSHPSDSVFPPTSTSPPHPTSSYPLIFAPTNPLSPNFRFSKKYFSSLPIGPKNLSSSSRPPSLVFIPPLQSRLDRSRLSFPSLSLAAASAGAPPSLSLSCFVQSLSPPSPLAANLRAPASPLPATSAGAPVLNFDSAGQPLTFRSALAGPFRDQWIHGDDDELVKLVKSTGTLTPVHTYTSTPTYYNRVIKEKWTPSALLRPGPSRSLADDVSRRVRGTAGGDRLPSSCPPSTDVASLTAVNIALNSVVSEDAFFGTADLTDFYLGTPVTLPLSQRQFIRIDVDSYSPAVLARLSLLPFIRSGKNGKRFVIFRIDQTMYGLKDAGKLSNLRLVSLLSEFGFRETATPCLFRHLSRPISFVLVVDDFGIKYQNRDDYDYLISCLSRLYHVKSNPIASKFLGFALSHNRAQRTLSLSYPGYVDALLLRLRPHGVKPAATPAVYHPPVYGSSSPQSATTVNSPPASAAQRKELEIAIGYLLYYGRCVDGRFLTATCALASAQSTATLATMADLDRLLGFASVHRHGVKVFRPSTMTLDVLSDASFLSRPNAGSVAGSFHHLARSNDPAFFNAPISLHSTRIPVVCSSVQEAEYGGTFAAAKIAVEERKVLADFGYPQPPTTIHCDNEVAVGLANQTIKPKLSKSCDMRFHWLQERVRRLQFRVQHVRGLSNVSDYLTKSLPVSRHKVLAPFIALDPSTAHISPRFPSS